MQAIFFNRDFSGTRFELQAQVNVVRYSWVDMGGPSSAKLIIGDVSDKWELLKLLRCPVEIYGDDLSKPVWWGMVNSIGIPQGFQRFGYSLDALYNNVIVRYGQEDLTEEATDDVSISEYGQKELVLRSYDLTGLEAAQLRSMELSTKSNIHQNAEITYTSGDNETIEIECIGWYDTLRWKHYTNTTESNVENTTQISTIVSSVGQFIEGTIVEDTAGVLSNQTRDARDGLSCVNELLQAGTSNYRPLLAYVDRNRYLHVYERAAQPPTGSVDYVMREDARLETVTGGTYWQDEYCTVAKWVRAKGSPLEYSFFIESAQYVVANDKATYRPAGSYEQRRLAKYIQDIVTGDGIHVWPGLIPPGLTDPQIFTPFWVALGKEGDTITTIRGVAWDSTNNILYCTGQFTVIGGIEAVNFAKLDMATGQWYALNTIDAPGATNYGWAVAIVSSKIYFGTQGAGVGCFWEYDESTDTWTDLSSGTSGPVNTLAVDGTDVYLGGAFTSMPSSADSNYISKWNGSSFDALSTGMTYSGGGAGGVFDIAISGGYLYAVGKFDDAGGESVLNVAVWDGVGWAALGSIGVLGNNVLSVDVYNGDVYADSGGAASGSDVIRWNGSEWVTVGATNGEVQGFAVSADGAFLYTIGSFTTMNGITVGNSTYWDGGNWYTMNTGLAGATIANGDLTMFDSIHPVAVGNFTTADGNPALGIAMYITTLQGLLEHLTNTGGVSRPGGPDQAVQYNYDGRFGGSKYMLFDYDNQQFLFGTGTDKHVIDDGYILVAEGEYLRIGDGTSTPTTSYILVGDSDYIKIYEPYDDQLAIKIAESTHVLKVGYNDTYTHISTIMGDIDGIDHSNTLTINESGIDLTVDTGTFNVETSSNNTFVVDPTNKLIGINSAPAAGKLVQMVTPATTTVGLFIYGMASQTADLLSIYAASTANTAGIKANAGLYSFGTQNLQFSGMVVKNTSTGNASQANIQVTNNASKIGTIAMWGSNHSNATYANQMSVSSTTGILFSTDIGVASGGTSTISFATGGYNNAASIIYNANGSLSVVGRADNAQLIVKAYSSQTTNILELQNSSSTVLAKVDDAGNAQFGYGEAGALTLGAGQAGIDYTLTFDGETNDGVLTWMEDEDYFQFQDAIRVPTYERHIQIPAFLSGNASNQPTADDIQSAGGLVFSSASNQSAFIQWEVPDDWAGDDIYIEIDWAPFSAAMSGTDALKWDVDYRAIAEGETLTNGTLAQLTNTDDGDYAQYETYHRRLTLPYDDANQPLTAQDHIYFEIRRDVSVTNDFAGTVIVTAFEIVYNSVTIPTN